MSTSNNTDSTPNLVGSDVINSHTDSTPNLIDSEINSNSTPQDRLEGANSSEFDFTTDEETDSFYGDTSDSELFTMYCPTCFLSFPEEQTYKLHYKSDLHLYNVKRKLVGLKPATIEKFSTRTFYKKLIFFFRN